VARRSGQIPLDDEPMDIDLGDLPSEEEFAEAEAEAAEPGAPGETSYAGSTAAEPPGALALFQTWVTFVAIIYFVLGWVVGLLFAFWGAGGVGLAALSHPTFYLLVLFWPIAVWKLVLNQY
jgi:hypothetical protein